MVTYRFQADFRNPRTGSVFTSKYFKSRSETEAAKELFGSPDLMLLSSRACWKVYSGSVLVGWLYKREAVLD